jgi:hypothetical protein
MIAAIMSSKSSVSQSLPATATSPDDDGPWITVCSKRRSKRS